MAVFAAATAAAVLDSRVTGVLSAVCGGLAFCMLILCIPARRLSEKRRACRLVLAHGALVLLAAGTMFGLYAHRYAKTAAPVRQLDGAAAEVLMEPLDFPEQRYGKYYYPIRVLDLDGQPVTPFQVRLSSSEALDCEPCSPVKCRLTFYLFQNDGIYSTYASQLAEGNLLGAYPSGYDPFEYLPQQGDGIPAGRLLPLLRSFASRAIDRCLSGDEAALLQTALLGRGSQLSDQVYTDFRQIGCSHMLAVSGLHLTLAGAFFSLLLARVPMPRKVRSGVSIFLLLFCLLMTGFPVSAMRSYVMFVFCSIGAASYRPADTFNSLGGAVMLLCFTNPFVGGSVGFALSVLATAGIALLGRQFEEMICSLFNRPGPFLRYVSGSAATCLSATVFTLPIQIAVFRGLPLLTLVSNLLLLPLFVAILYSSIPLLIIALLDPAFMLLEPFVLLCGTLCRLLVKICHLLAGLPGVYLSLNSPVLTVSLILLLAGISFCLLRPSRLRKTATVLAVTVALMLPLMDSELRQDTVTLAISGDSQSACVVAMCCDRAAVLSMGTFNSGLARQIIARENIRTLDSVLITGGGYHTQSMARDLLSSRRPEKLWLTDWGGKELRYPGVSLEALPDNGLYQALPGLFVQAEPDGLGLRIWANDRKVLLYTGGAVGGDEAYEGFSGESCGLLITNRPMPELCPELTFFICDDGIPPEEAAVGLDSEFYMVTDQQVTYVDIAYDGEVTVRRG